MLQDTYLLEFVFILVCAMCVRLSVVSIKDLSPPIRIAGSV